MFLIILPLYFANEIFSKINEDSQSLQFYFINKIIHILRPTVQDNLNKIQLMSYEVFNYYFLLVAFYYYCYYQFIIMNHYFKICNLSILCALIFF